MLLARVLSRCARRNCVAIAHAVFAFIFSPRGKVHAGSIASTVRDGVGKGGDPD